MLYRLVLLVLSIVVLAFILRGVIKDVRTRLREEVEKRKPRRHFEAVEEPKTWMEKREGRTIFRVSLPGVKSGDVHLRRLKESLELKAYARGKVYFTLLRIPSNSRLVSEKLEKGVYVIEVAV
jgi:flagellar biosynthesis/type III secretory pathway M-ring protein FliF/YscJ